MAGLQGADRDQTAIDPAEGDAAIQQVQQIAEVGRAIVRIAEQQIELQRRQAALRGRMDVGGGSLVNELGELLSTTKPGNKPLPGELRRTLLPLWSE